MQLIQTKEKKNKILKKNNRISCVYFFTRFAISFHSFHVKVNNLTHAIQQRYKTAKATTTANSPTKSRNVANSDEKTTQISLAFR